MGNGEFRHSNECHRLQYVAADACAFALDIPLLHRVLLSICSCPVHRVRMAVHDNSVARRGSRRSAAAGMPICVSVCMSVAHDAVAVRRRMHRTYNEEEIT